MNPIIKLLVVFVVTGASLSCSALPFLRPTPTPLPTATFTPRPTSTHTHTPVPTVTRALTHTPTPPAPTPDPTPSLEVAETAYAALLERVKQADPDVDFTALRLAFTETDAYDPYNFQLGELQQEMYTALNADDYATTLELANQILDVNYVSVDTHLAALLAYEGLGEADMAEYHQYVLNGLIDSILASGDGLTSETAFVVIFVEEEYAVLSVLGIESDGQQLLEEDDHSYDVFEGVDTNTNEAVTIYFNVDLVLGWLTNSLTP